MPKGFMRHARCSPLPVASNQMPETCQQLKPENFELPVTALLLHNQLMKGENHSEKNHLNRDDAFKTALVIHEKNPVFIHRGVIENFKKKIEAVYSACRG